MSAPLVPSPLDYIGRRRFAFYPPIRHADPNEWVLGSGSYTQVQVVNAHTGREIWLSRQYVGAVSETSHSLLLVGLTKTLEFRQGMLEPSEKRIIEMPSAELVVGGRLHPVRRFSSPGEIVEIRLGSRADTVFNKTMTTACIGAVTLALLTALIAAAIRF